MEGVYYVSWRFFDTAARNARDQVLKWDWMKIDLDTEIHLPVQYKMSSMKLLN